MNKKVLALWKRIAEIRGYKFRKNGCVWEYLPPDHKETTNAWGDIIPPHWTDCFYDLRGNDFSFCSLESVYNRSSIPKYTEDLNAIHELEMWLKNDKTAHLEYGALLYFDYCRYLNQTEGPCASAKQRCYRLIKFIFPNEDET